LSIKRNQAQAFLGSAEKSLLENLEVDFINRGKLGYSQLSKKSDKSCLIKVMQGRSDFLRNTFYLLKTQRTCQQRSNERSSSSGISWSRIERTVQ